MTVSATKIVAELEKKMNVWRRFRSLEDENRPRNETNRKIGCISIEEGGWNPKSSLVGIVGISGTKTWPI